MSNEWDFDEQGPSIYPKYEWDSVRKGSMLLSHAKRTADRKPRAIEAIESSTYRFKKTPTWIQALIKSNKGVHPRCSKEDCNKAAEHGAHMNLVWVSDDEEWELTNTKTGQKETERQHEVRARLVIPVCQDCHQSGLVNVHTIRGLSLEQTENSLYIPEVIIIDSCSDEDLIADDNYFGCPGCQFDEVEFPRWHHTDEYYLPIDTCRGCERIIYSMTKYSHVSSDYRCDCESSDEDEYGYCIGCGMYVQFHE